MKGGSLRFRGFAIYVRLMSNEIEIYTRAGELDALGAIIPPGRAEHLASVLSDSDVATLRHMAEKGMGEHTLRALVSDIAYIEAWTLASTGDPLPWPAPVELLLKFVAHHLWDPVEKEKDPSHGMPDDVRSTLSEGGFLRSAGPHAPSTVRRRLASWSTLSQWRDVEGQFHSPALRKALRLAVRAQGRPRTTKSAEAVTGDVLRALLRPLDDMAGRRVAKDDREGLALRLTALRDRAILSIAFASGGRRRSEVAGLYLSQIKMEEPIEDYRDDGAMVIIPSCTINLGRTKTTSADESMTVGVAGRAVTDLEDWLKAAQITSGPVFRRIDRWGKIGKDAISDKAINNILKRRVGDAGYNPTLFSAHGLRSGFMTEAMEQGLSLSEAMAQTTHRSVQQASSYFDRAKSRTGRAARLLK
jgi:integrase